MTPLPTPARMLTSSSAKVNDVPVARGQEHALLVARHRGQDHDFVALVEPAHSAGPSWSMPSRNGASGVRSVMPVRRHDQQVRPRRIAAFRLSSSAGTNRSSVVTAPMILTWSSSLKNLAIGSP